MQNHIFIQNQQQIIRVNTADIILVEASGRYSLLKSTKKNHLVRTPISKLEALLSPHGFVRVHRKFMVPISRITHVERKRVALGTTYVPIGLSYYKNFLEQLDIVQ